MVAGRRHNKGRYYAKHSKQLEYHVCDSFPCASLTRVMRGAQANVAFALVYVTAEPKFREPKSFIISSKSTYSLLQRKHYLYYIDSKQTWSFLRKEAHHIFPPRLFPRNKGFYQSFSCLHCHILLLSLGHPCRKVVKEEKVLIRIFIPWIFFSWFNWQSNRCSLGLFFPPTAVNF